MWALGPPAWAAQLEQERCTPHLIQGCLLLLVLKFLDTHVLIILLYPHLHKSYTGRWYERSVRQ